MNRNICFFNTIKTWGGGEKWHLEMALCLKNAGYPVVLGTSPGSALYRKAIENGLPCFPVSVSNLSFLNPFKRLRLAAFFRNRKIHTLFLNHPSDVKLAGMAAKTAGVKNIIYRRGSAVPVKNSFLNRYLFGHVLTHVIANSQATKNTLLQNNPALFPQDKIQVMYNGIDLSAVRPPVRAINRDVVVLGNIGRMVHQKGQHYLIELAKRLRQRNLNFRVLIGGDGPMLNDLKKRVDNYNLSDCVFFPGFIDDVFSFMHSIDIFLLPSLWEGFGFVIAEAMACHKPVVAWNLSSNPELIMHNVNGLLIPAFDMDRFTDAVVTLMDSPVNRTRMGDAGFELCQSQFSLAAASSRLLNFVNQLHLTDMA